MAADSHGKSPNNKHSTAMNGQPNGHIDHRRRSSKRKAQKTYTAWAGGLAARLFVWYALITLLFRCPSAQKDVADDSPRICKPYLQARDYVTPYAQPYYDQYLSPYVQQAQPYVDRFNDNVYAPGLVAYKQYGAPRVADAQKFGQKQWEKTVKPQLELLQKQSGKQYQQHLGPHVQKAQDAVQPYYDQVKTSVSDIWELELEPVYRKTRPYAEKLYYQGQDFAVNTALPQAQYAGSTAWSFWTRQIWPRMRILYGENVEPQLLRITERLGRYKDGKKLEAEIKSMESSSKFAEASASAESTASSLSSVVKEATVSPSSAASVATSAKPEPTPDPKVQFAEDLKSWEHISAKAVEEGTEDLTERIKDITDRQVKSAESVGDALVIQLEQTAGATENSVKARILQIVKQVPEDADDEQIETANDDLTSAIRAAGQNVKQRAQAVREWRLTNQAETEDLVEKALQSTLETIDNIRELRLTEIGRKYASSSLPHKEWAKYNDLKKATQAWRDDVKKAAYSHPGIASAKAAGEDVENRAMAVAEDAAKELSRLKNVGKWKIAANDDSEDFDTKHVPPPVRKAKEQIVEKVAEASQAVFGEEEQDAAESLSSQASEKASSLSEKVVGSSTGSVESVVSKASEKIVGREQPVVESVTSKVAESAKSASSAASEAVVGTESGLSDSATDAASSISSAIVGTESGLSDSATDAASKASEAVVESPNSLAEKIKSSASSRVANMHLTQSAGAKLASALSAQKESSEAASKSAKSVANKASKSASSIAEKATGKPPVASQVSSGASFVMSEASSGAKSAASAVSDAVPDAESVASAADEVVSSATESPKKIFAGAMAQVLVEAREPIMDDVVDGAESFSESIQSMASVAGDKASELTKAVEDAMKAATKTQGTVEIVTSLASEQYESAMAAASSVLFGSQNAAEMGTSVAREQYLSAVTAASYAIYGTPANAAPVAAASSAYDHAVSEASRHYEQVKARVSEQISGTPKPVHKQMFSSAESAYSAAVSAASENMQAAMGSTSQNVFESMSSVASQRLAEGVSAASEQYASAKTALGATPTPAHQQYLAQAQKAYYEALGVAHGRYSEFLDAASSLVSPTPTAIGVSASMESAMSDARSAYTAYTSEARSKYSLLLSMASSAANVGGHKTVDESVMENLQGQLADAMSIGSSKLAQASTEVSSAVIGKETPATESIASQASENWEALISKASEQVYGAPPPFTESIASRAGEMAEQATEAAAAQYSAVSSLFAELVSGKEPDFTESVYSRLQSAYSTGAPSMMSQASSYASEAYAQAASAVSAAFVPPTQVPGKSPSTCSKDECRLTFTGILEQMQAQMDAAVEAASSQVYGAEKGTYEVSRKIPLTSD